MLVFSTAGEELKVLAEPGVHHVERFLVSPFHFSSAQHPDETNDTISNPPEDGPNAALNARDTLIARRTLWERCFNSVEVPDHANRK